MTTTTTTITTTTTTRQQRQQQLLQQRQRWQQRRRRRSGRQRVDRRASTGPSVTAASVSPLAPPSTTPVPLPPVTTISGPYPACVDPVRTFCWVRWTLPARRWSPAKVDCGKRWRARICNVTIPHVEATLRTTAVCRARLRGARGVCCILCRPQKSPATSVLTEFVPMYTVPPPLKTSSTFSIVAQAVQERTLDNVGNWWALLSRKYSYRKLLKYDN